MIFFIKCLPLTLHVNCLLRNYSGRLNLKLESKKKKKKKNVKLIYKTYLHVNLEAHFVSVEFTFL